MNKQSAIYLMESGPHVKMTHTYFSEEEYIYMINHEIYDEKDYKMSFYIPGQGHITFWTDRTGPEWEEGWSIFITDAEKLLIANEENMPNLKQSTRYYQKPSPNYQSKNSHKRTNKKQKQN